MKAQPIPIGPWPKGVNLLDSVGTLEEDELSVCTNYRLNLKGYPYKRPGGAKLGSTPTKVDGDHITNFLHRYYNDSGVKELLSIVNQKLFKINDNTGVPTQIDVYDRGNPGATVNLGNTILNNTFTYKNRVYILDGNQPIRYNGTDATYAGHFEPPAPTIGRTAGATTLGAGTYKYRIASVAGDMGEGKATGEVSIVATAGDTINLSVIVDAPSRHEETAKRIYRTTAGGSEFFFLAEIAHGVTVYNDSTPDANLGSSLITVHPPKANAKFALLGPDDRVYWFGMDDDASLVEPSDPGFPDKIYDSEFFTVANGDGDQLTGGARCSAGLVFFKRNSTYLVRSFGTAPIQLSGKIGCISSKSIVEVPGGIIFLSTRGEIYFFDSVNLTEIGKKVKPEFLGLGSGGHSRVVACYHDFRYIISYDYRGNKGYNFKTLEYDLITGKWDGPHYNGDYVTPGFYCVYDSGKDNNELLWAEANANKGSYVFIRKDYSYMDDGSIRFNSLIRTGSLKLGVGEKVFTKGIVKGRFTGDTKIKLSVILDDEIEQIDCYPINELGGGFSAFDEAKFDLDVFSVFLIKVGDDPLDISARAKTPLIQLEDNGSSAYHEIEEINLLGSGIPLK